LANTFRKAVKSALGTTTEALRAGVLLVAPPRRGARAPGTAAPRRATEHTVTEEAAMVRWVHDLVRVKLAVT